MNQSKQVFQKLVEKSKNRSHDLMGVPLIMILGVILHKIKAKGIDAGSIEISMFATKVGMEDYAEKIIDYCDKNIDEAIMEVVANAPLDW